MPISSEQLAKERQRLQRESDAWWTDLKKSTLQNVPSVNWSLLLEINLGPEDPVLAGFILRRTGKWHHHDQALLVAGIATELDWKVYYVPCSWLQLSYDQTQDPTSPLKWDYRPDQSFNKTTLPVGFFYA